LDDARIKAGNPAVVFGGSLLLALLAAFSLAMFIGKAGGWSFGLFAGFMTGAFFVSTFLGIIYLFERKPFALYAINAGYCTLTFSAMGAVLGLWK
jgi:hypothetical protein